MTIDRFFSDRVSFRSQLPLQWEACDRELDAGQLASLNEQNLALLRAVAALEERHPDSTENQQALLGPEIQRLEAKLDLVLTLVGQLRTASGIVPASATVELSAHGVAWWPGEQAGPEVGEVGILSLSLAAYAAQPLKLTAKILAQEHWEGDEAVLAEYFGVNDSVADALEKFVFRHHRRAIAGQRSAAEE